MANPVIAEVTRGGIVESRHRGAFCVVNAEGRVVAQAGDIGRPVFPRSSIKAFQALAIVEAGVADCFGFSDAEIALACASHRGETEHISTARAMLAKIGLNETSYECGPHWPNNTEAAHALARVADHPERIHNNCSGKHAGMLGLAVHLGVEPAGYVKHGHAVQRAVAKVIGEMCDVDMKAAQWGVDGCSVPTWALPLERVAHGFARFGSGRGLSKERAAACRRIVDAVRAHPFMVAGTGRFCTNVMQAVPDVFIKTGAEGYYSGMVPAAGIGIALKCDDGGSRAAECLIGHVLSRHCALGEAALKALEKFHTSTLTNAAGIEIGEVRAV